MQRKSIHVLTRAVILDQDHILVCKTLDLPKNFYFLPGGHVEDGESVEQALLREVSEEIGVGASVKKFLGCLEYLFEPGHSSKCHNHEYTLIFQVESDMLKRSLPLAQPLAHLELMWIPVNSIEGLDFRAEPLKEALPRWLKEEHRHAFCSFVQ